MADNVVLVTTGTDDSSKEGPGDQRDREQAPFGHDALSMTDGASGDDDTNLILNIEQFQFNGQILTLSSLVPLTGAAATGAGPIEDAAQAHGVGSGHAGDVFFFSAGDGSNAFNHFETGHHQAGSRSSADEPEEKAISVDRQDAPVQPAEAEIRQADVQGERLGEDDFLF